MSEGFESRRWIGATLTAWVAMSLAACIPQSGPATMPDAEEVPVEPVVEEQPQVVETPANEVVTEPAPEMVEPDPAPEEFEGPTDEEIDQTLRGLLGDDPVDLVRDPDAVAARLPLEMNDRVETWINYFQNVIPERFGLYLERKAKFEPMIREKLREQGMPQDLIYLSLIESGFSPNAYSRAAAVGLWQFISSTGRFYDLEVSFWVDERRDPEKATDAALSYLSDLHDQFGSWFLAAAAYNGGPGRVSRGLARTGGGTFWDLADARLLRSETRNYVPKIIAAAMIGHDPARYGFDNLEPQEPVEYEFVRVPDATSFDVLAEAAGVDEEVIEQLNPQFPQRVTPPDRGVDFKVPLGTAGAFETAYAMVPEDERVTWTFHVVARGQTLGGIGSAYGISVTALRAANGNINPRRLQIGQRLVIPMASRSSSAASSQAQSSTAQASSNEPASRAESTDDSASENANAEVSGGQQVEESGTRTVVVRRGDSLWTIARRYSVSTDDLMRWNNLSSTMIRPGDQLQIRQ